jgi:hypothetical protein
MGGGEEAVIRVRGCGKEEGMPHRHVPPHPPRRDPSGPSVPPSRLTTLALVAMLNRRRKDKDPDHGGVPVEPNRPNTLSGGAAAALEFDDD